MDPSNNNSFGSPQVPGSSGGVGLSGADFGAQNGGNVAQSAGSTAQNAGAIVSGAGTTVDNTGTGGAGGFKSSNFPSGGITIGSEKRSRKGLIIAAVAVVLLLGGGLVTLAIVNGAFDVGTNKNEADSLEISFNRYANYLVSGEVKDDATTEAMFESVIAIDNEYSNEAFMSNASELFELFYNIASNASGENDEKNILDQSRDDLAFLLESAKMKTVSNEELQQKYIEGGKEKTLEYLNEQFAVKDEENEKMIILKDYTVLRGNILMDYWDYYKEKGCLMEDGYDEMCVAAIPQSELSALSEQLSGVERSIYNLFYYTVDDIKIEALAQLENLK
jgi:hypothetical protein